MLLLLSGGIPVVDQQAILIGSLDPVTQQRIAVQEAKLYGPTARFWS